MPIEQVITQAFQRALFDFVLIAIFFGFVGALICGFLQSSAEKFADKLIAKRRALEWKKRQDMAKAEQGAQPRGDDVAGRACETRSGGAA